MVGVGVTAGLLKTLSAQSARIEQKSDGSQDVTPQATGFEEALTQVITKLGYGHAADSLNEEELFAGVIQAKLSEDKGTFVADEFQRIMDENIAEKKASGKNFSYERQAKRALRTMQRIGAISNDEALNIQGIAFESAQLDLDTKHLFDHAGNTAAVATTIEAKKLAIDKVKAIADRTLSGSSSILTTEPANAVLLEA